MKVPLRLCEDGFLGRLRPAELSLLLVVLYKTTFISDGRVQIKAGELQKLAGISRRAFFNSIRKLSAGKIIDDQVAGYLHDITLLPSKDWNLKYFVRQARAPRKRGGAEPPRTERGAFPQAGELKTLDLSKSM